MHAMEQRQTAIPYIRRAFRRTDAEPVAMLVVVQDIHVSALKKGSALRAQLGRSKG